MGRIESHLSAREQGTFPSQPQPYSRLQCQAKTMNKSDGQLRQAHTVTTLRSGKIIEDISKESPQVVEVSKDTTSEAECEQILQRMGQKRKSAFINLQLHWKN